MTLPPRRRISFAHASPLAVVALWALATPGCGSGNDAPTPTPGSYLEPPDHGVQLHIARFPVAKGGETQHCYYFKLPSDVDIEVVRFQISFLAGSHHMNLFRTTTAVPDHDAECFTKMDFASPTNVGGVDLIVGSQSNAMDWKLPDGVAFKLKAHTQLVLQTHYVNASTQTTALDAGEVWVNLNTAPDPTKITAHVGTMFANNMQIHIPPHQSASFTTSCGVDHDVNVIAATGHFHSRGKTFEVNACANNLREADATPFFVSKAWQDPPFLTLKTPIKLSAGGGLQYTCDYQNDTDLDITFGPHVESQEHCNLFAYFYPSEDDHARYCF
jgi:hypothetical protein